MFRYVSGWQIEVARKPLGTPGNDLNLEKVRPVKVASSSASESSESSEELSSEEPFFPSASSPACLGSSCLCVSPRFFVLPSSAPSLALEISQARTRPFASSDSKSDPKTKSDAIVAPSSSRLGGRNAHSLCVRLQTTIVDPIPTNVRSSRHASAEMFRGDVSLGSSSPSCGPTSTSRIFSQL